MAFELLWYDDRDAYDEPVADRWRFTAQDHTLADALGVRSNHEAQRLVHAAVTAVDSVLAERIEFDSEYSCFFAYADSRADMEALAEIVGAVVAFFGYMEATGDAAQ